MTSLSSDPDLLNCPFYKPARWWGAQEMLDEPSIFRAIVTSLAHTGVDPIDGIADRKTISEIADTSGIPEQMIWSHVLTYVLRPRADCLGPRDD